MNRHEEFPQFDGNDTSSQNTDGISESNSLPRQRLTTIFYREKSTYWLDNLQYAEDGEGNQSKSGGEPFIKDTGEKLDTSLEVTTDHPYWLDNLEYEKEPAVSLEKEANESSPSLPTIITSSETLPVREESDDNNPDRFSDYVSPLGFKIEKPAALWWAFHHKNWEKSYTRQKTPPFVDYFFFHNERLELTLASEFDGKEMQPLWRPDPQQKGLDVKEREYFITLMRKYVHPDLSLNMWGEAVIENKKKNFYWVDFPTFRKEIVSNRKNTDVYIDLNKSYTTPGQLSDALKITLEIARIYISELCIKNGVQIPKGTIIVGPDYVFGK